MLNYYNILYAAGTPSLMPDGEVHACPEETLTFTCQTQSRLQWMIRFEGVLDSTVEQTYLSTDSEGMTMINERRGIQFTFNLTTSNITSSLLVSTMKVFTNRSTLLNGATVNCGEAGGVTPTTVINLRGIN